MRSPAAGREISVEGVVQALSDHLSYTEALCDHPDDAPVDAVIRHLPGYPFRSSSATVACVLYNVTKRQVTVCKGPPCQGVFGTFELGGMVERGDIENIFAFQVL